MFVVCIGDGLGNQMFQYAFFRALEKKYPLNNISADICNFYGSVNNHNGYELKQIFGIDISECDARTSSVLADFIPNSTHKWLNKFYQTRRVLFGNKESFIVQDDPTAFYEGVFELSQLKSYMFRGNWINEHYFANVKKEILEAFVFPQINDSKNKEIEKQIKESESVSIHVRRGDYLKTNMYHLSTNYYKRAIKMIREEVENPVFFIFSDDENYVKTEFSFLNDNERVIVNWNTGKDSFRDMQLMSLCKHNIIANSTFSFWGGYLNNNPQKIVIAPDKASRAYRNPFACEEWIKLSVEDGEYETDIED